MSLFKRIKNIIKSNIPHNDDIKVDFDTDEMLSNYDDICYGDAKDIPTEDLREKEYYKILELEYGAGFDKIKSAYKRLLKKYHPDMFHNKPEKLKSAQKLTEKINEAYTYFERKYK